MSAIEELDVLFVASEQNRADIAQSAINVLSSHPSFLQIIASQREEDGATPLHIAAHHASVDVLRILIPHGLQAKGWGGPFRGKRPYECAGDSAASRVFHIVCFEATASGKLPLVRALLDGGVPVSVSDDSGSGDSLLHWACAYGHYNLSALLIERGASLDEPNVQGATPLHEAVAAGQKEIVRLLLFHGADTALKATSGPWSGKTALELSSSEEMEGIFLDFSSLAPHRADLKGRLMKQASDSLKPTTSDAGSSERSSERGRLRTSSSLSSFQGEGKGVRSNRTAPPAQSFPRQHFHHHLQYL